MDGAQWHLVRCARVAWFCAGPCARLFSIVSCVVYCAVQAVTPNQLQMSVREFLAARGCSFGDERFVVILEFLTDADVVCPDDFIGLRGIAEIPGVDVLTLCELISLQDVVDKVSAEEQNISLEHVCTKPEFFEPCTIAASQTKWRRLEQQLIGSKASDLDIASKGPRAAGALLLNNLKRGLDRHEWIERARVAAIVGSCPKSHKSAISGLRCWAWFAINVLHQRGDLLPPSLTPV